jgi:hypothetical protein
MVVPADLARRDDNNKTGVRRSTNDLYIGPEKEKKISEESDLPVLRATTRLRIHRYHEFDDSVVFT